MGYQETYSVFDLDFNKTYNKLGESKYVVSGYDIEKGTVSFWLKIDNEKVNVQISNKGSVNVWHDDLKVIRKSVEILKTLTIDSNGDICSKWILKNSQIIGSKSLAQPLTDDSKAKKDHDKLIVNETKKIWKEKIEHVKPYGILWIDRFGEKITIDFSPFVINNNISYFESHLENGYPNLWSKISEWKRDYSELVKRTEELLKHTRSFIEDAKILPTYNILEHNREHIHYESFLYSFSHSVNLELENQIRFGLKLGEYMSGDQKWYTLEMAPQIGGSFSKTTDLDKISQLKRKIEKFHSCKSIYEQFKDIYYKDKQLNDLLPSILEELEGIWAEVENGVPLKGWCKAGINGQYEYEESK